MTTESERSEARLHPIVIRPEWVRAIAKAASSIRFTADNWEWVTDEAKRESLEIAATLTEIENAMCSGYAKSQVMATEQGHVAEEAFYDAHGRMVGYWVQW